MMMVVMVLFTLLTNNTRETSSIIIINLYVCGDVCNLCVWCVMLFDVWFDVYEPTRAAPLSPALFKGKLLMTQAAWRSEGRRHTVD